MQKIRLVLKLSLIFLHRDWRFFDVGRWTFAATWILSPFLLYEVNIYFCMRGLTDRGFSFQPDQLESSINCPVDIHFVLKAILYAKWPLSNSLTAWSPEGHYASLNDSTKCV